MLSIVSKKDYIRIGKEIVEDNQFYYTLSILLKCYFVNQKNFYMLDFLKEITKSEMDFKVFLIYKDYGIHIYQTIIKDFLKEDESIDEIVYNIIYHVKTEYDKDRKVLLPFIENLNENENQVLEMFNFIKAGYQFKIETLTKFEQIKQAISYLEKSKQLKKDADKYSEMAMVLLCNLKENFGNTIKTIDNMEIKLIKN